MAANRFGNAIKVFSKALAVDTENEMVAAEFLVKRSEAYRKNNENADALQDLSTILMMQESNHILSKEEHWDVLNRRAKLNRFCYRYRESIIDFKAMLLLEPDSTVLQTIHDIYNKKIAVTTEHRSNAAILGVVSHPDWNAVKTRYRKISLQSHPDKFSATEQEKKD